MRRSLFASTRVPALRRVPAAALLVFALVGQFANLAHLVLVRHEVCLEHGELVHAEAEAASGVMGPTDLARADLRMRRDSSGAAIRARAVDSSGAAIRARSAGATHDHDHCSVAAHRRENALRSAPSRSILEPSTAAVVALRSDRTFRSSGRDILGFAPKCSPPA